MLPERTWSQSTFEKMERLIHEMKQKALARNNPDGWGDADKMHFLLLDLINDLIVEGAIKA